MRELLQQPDTLVALEPEELAGFVLQDLNERTDRQDRLNLSRHNYLNEIRLAAADRRVEVLRAVTEAWTWLGREGLIATDPEQGGEWVFVTRRGRRLTGRDAFAAFRHAGRLPRGQLHPSIAERVWPAFLRGDYDTAVFQAFREVEVAVRQAAVLSAEEIGVTLMRRAFGPNGALADSAAPEGEREAVGHLFAGAIGCFKNPQSHRAVNLGDPTEAAEIIVFASHLLRMVDRRVATREER